MSESIHRYTVAELAQKVGGTVVGPANASIEGINGVAEAGPSEITFVSARKYVRALRASKAGAALVSAEVAEALQGKDGRPLIVVPHPGVAQGRVLQLYATPEPLPDVGVHPAAFVHSTAVLGAEVRIGPQVTIERGAKIGDGAVLFAGVRVYADVEIGAHSVLHANVVVRHGCRIGARVILHQGVALGADGFGYVYDPDVRAIMKLPHIGDVIIEDDVELGANTCVDRGKFGSTIIRSGTKIDNLVQIGHNCIIGRGVMISAQTGIAGTTTVGDGVIIGGQVGIADHVTIGDGARLAAGTGVMRDVPPGVTLAGAPAEDIKVTMRQWACIRQLPAVLAQMKREAPDDPLH